MTRTPSRFALLALTTILATTAAATPVADGGTPTSLPYFTGRRAPRKSFRAKRPPTNPFMARRGVSNVHNDSWMSDTYWIRGPLGRSPQTFSAALGLVIGRRSHTAYLGVIGGIAAIRDGY